MRTEFIWWSLIFKTFWKWKQEFSKFIEMQRNAHNFKWMNFFKDKFGRGKKSSDQQGNLYFGWTWSSESLYLLTFLSNNFQIFNYKYFIQIQLKIEPGWAGGGSVTNSGGLSSSNSTSRPLARQHSHPSQPKIINNSKDLRWK